MNLEEINKTNPSPSDVIEWGIKHAEGNAIISTNFRPLEAVLLHMLVQVQPDIPVLWVDHGYNTPQTYKCAEQLIKKLNLNIKLYIPKRTSAHRDTVNGGIPNIEDVEVHDAFTEEVKLEPFMRGLAELSPTVWFTAVRKSQTDLRSNMDYVSTFQDNILKTAPVLDWDDAQMLAYIQEHDLADYEEKFYYDPTKVIENRECGLHKLN